MNLRLNTVARGGHAHWRFSTFLSKRHLGLPVNLTQEILLFAVFIIILFMTNYFRPMRKCRFDDDNNNGLHGDLNSWQAYICIWIMKAGMKCLKITVINFHWYAVRLRVFQINLLYRYGYKWKANIFPEAFKPISPAKGLVGMFTFGWFRIQMLPISNIEKLIILHHDRMNLKPLNCNTHLIGTCFYEAVFLIKKGDLDYSLMIVDFNKTLFSSTFTFG